MKILHTADLHLKELADDRWETLQKLIEIGKMEEISIFVISGDLFDEGVNAENLRPQIREIFSNNGFKIIIIPGNHDKDSYKSGMYFGEDAIILSDSSPFEYEDIRVVGMPFEPIGSKEVLDRLRSLKSVLTGDKVNILMYHGELLDSFFSRKSRKDFGEEGEERYMPLKLSYFKDMSIDYVLAGHFHTTFEVKWLENGGYFVYPGSPISITMREVGQRKVNIFEIGKPPKEYPLDTPHFKEVIVELDPFTGENPLETIKRDFEKPHPEARVLLTIRGYINGKEIQMTEPELVSQIKKFTAGKCAEEYYEFRDIQTILENDLFKSFTAKLEQAGYGQDKAKQMWDIATKAMMEAVL